MQPVIYLMGPTASGKTEVAARLYDEFECGLVSVDAVQVYRNMDIGTAKPDADFLHRYPHALIDIRDPSESYSAAEFCDDAARLIGSITRRQKIPVLVGGAMFYFSALENGLSDLPSSDAGIRGRIASDVRRFGLGHVYRALKKIDPETAARLSPQDSQRIQRAMEIYTISGIPPSQWMNKAKNPKPNTRIIKIALFAGDRKSLHRRIAKRFESMVEQGLIDEVQFIRKNLDEPDRLPSMRSVGYRQVIEYLNNKTGYQQMMENGIAATRQLAKRQLTWLRNQSDVVWFDAEQPDVMDSIKTYLRGHYRLMI